ncbi:unnamed protein product (macronuclear) [Paramecium tetraurelia]|uniref:Cyclic nucleotide-binding domain-containing protein n=1 Tax=Paramecium tetraurelia TaxID=5888 RepID=A0BTC2_PARTE|nr:uncharacterized protein GSPATT00032021001 [Paramecium tetraurelia]CAK61789.1 unnamed protein product [Paramecium tetraurelia]|eukprot:XP_001429187.1 hypothetical protein (macronuclear) [Paramecium tetraurelia strain d4-2]
MKIKRSIIQEQQPDHDLIRKQNEINLQPALQVYRMYTQLHTVAQAEQVADSLSSIDFIQKQCENSMKVRDFAMYAAQYFKYEYYSFGQTIMNQGEYGDRVYLLLNGDVGVYMKRSNEDVQKDLELSTQQCSETNIVISNAQKKKKTVLLNQLNKYELALRMLMDNTMYYNNGVPLFKKVWQYYSGQCFGDQALIYDQPRSASIIVVSEEAHLISMNKHDYKQVCEKQIQEQNANVDYFMKLFNGASKFTVTKFIQNLRTIQFSAQEILWKEGDEPKFYFLILKGRVQLYKYIAEEMITQSVSRKKKKIILSQLSDNSFVGQEEIIDSLPYRLYSCQVLDNTTAYFMEASEFNNLKKNFPEIVKLLKDKSSLISDYMNIRQNNIISILSQHENQQKEQPQLMITERKTVQEIFKDPHDRPDKNDIRSQKPKILLQTEIAHQNMLYHQKKLPTDAKTQFLMVDTNLIEQIRDRVSRKIWTGAEKKQRVKTTHLDDNQILTSRVQSALNVKSKKMQRFSSLETILQITSSEPHQTSPTFITSSTNTIPLIQRSWNPQSRQLKAKLRRKMSGAMSQNTLQSRQVENEDIFSHLQLPQRIHTAKSSNRKNCSSFGLRKKSDQVVSYI